MSENETITSIKDNSSTSIAVPGVHTPPWKSPVPFPPVVIAEATVGGVILELRLSGSIFDLDRDARERIFRAADAVKRFGERGPGRPKGKRKVASEQPTRSE